MYGDVAQWQHIRRRFKQNGTPKKQISRETGISRRMINKMLAHENPPGYGPRLPRYPKLGPHIPTIERLLQTTVSSAPATIRDIVECLRREEDFAGSYDSVRNYIRRRARDDANAWEQAYDLVVQLPKNRALDFIRLLSRGNPSIQMSTRVRPFMREAASPRKPPIRSLQRRLASRAKRHTGSPRAVEAPPQWSFVESQSRHGSVGKSPQNPPPGNL